MTNKFLAAPLLLLAGGCIMPTDYSPFDRCGVYSDPGDHAACLDRVQTELMIRGELRSLRLDRMSRGGPY